MIKKNREAARFAKMLKQKHTDSLSKSKFNCVFKNLQSRNSTLTIFSYLPLSVQLRVLTLVNKSSYNLITSSLKKGESKLKKSKLFPLLHLSKRNEITSYNPFSHKTGHISILQTSTSPSLCKSPFPSNIQTPKVQELNKQEEQLNPKGAGLFRLSNNLVFVIEHWRNKENAFFNAKYRNRCFLFYFNKRVLQCVAKLRIQRTEFGVAITSDAVYCVAGFNHTGTLKVSEKIRVSDGKQEVNRINVAPVNMKRCEFTICVFDNKYLYAIGGSDGFRSLSTFEIYDIKQNTWKLHSLKMTSFEELAPSTDDLDHSSRKTHLINDKRVHLSKGGCCQISGKEILVFGGVKTNRTLKIENKSYILNIDSNEMTQIRNILNEDSFNELYCYSNAFKVYALGETGIHIYNTKNHEWEFSNLNEFNME